MQDHQRELARAVDALLVVHAQRGGTDAFRQRVDRYERRLLYFVRRMVGEQEEAFDILQETWVTAHRRIVRLREPMAFSAWIYRIARDHAIDRLRRRRPNHAWLEELPEEPAANSDEDFADLERAENAERVHRCLAEMTPAHREVLVLRFLEEMSLEQIRDVVGCSLGTVKSRLFHAKRWMRRKIEENGHGSE